MSNIEQGMSNVEGDILCWAGGDGRLRGLKADPKEKVLARGRSPSTLLGAGRVIASLGRVQRGMGCPTAG
jgi:hypothetical protein